MNSVISYRIKKKKVKKINIDVRTISSIVIDYKLAKYSEYYQYRTVPYSAYMHRENIRSYE